MGFYRDGRWQPSAMDIASGEYVDPTELKITEFERLERIQEQYYELIMAVENKYSSESRHQAALRLIKEAQSTSRQAVQADAKSCPLYVDYKKSCKAWRDREEELNRTA